MRRPPVLQPVTSAVGALVPNRCVTELPLDKRAEAWGEPDDAPVARHLGTSSQRGGEALLTSSAGGGGSGGDGWLSRLFRGCLAPPAVRGGEGGA